MSTVSCVGGEGNLLDASPRQCRMLELPHPFLTSEKLAKLRRNALPDFRCITLPMLFQVAGDPERNLYEAIRTLCRSTSRAIADGYSILVLSDRGIDESRAAIPSLLATAAVHHHLIREGTRVRAGLVVESGEPREVAHMALLLGYGAGAVNPYLALETIADLCARGLLPGDQSPDRAARNYIKALKKGLLKTMAKMGISTLASYQGAQIFEAIGIDQFVIDEYLTGTASRIRGVGLRRPGRGGAGAPPAGLQPRPARGAGPRAATSISGSTASATCGTPGPSPACRRRCAWRTPRATGVRPAHERPWRVPDRPARAVGPGAGGRAGAPGRGGAGGGDRQALRQRRHVVRQHLQGGPREPGHRHEPHGRPLQHRGGRRGPGPLHPRPGRRLPAQRDQAGGLGPVRRHRRVPGGRRRDPDQDGPGRQARRRRPAARAQGGRHHRPGAPQHARGDPHLAAAAP